MISFRMQAVAAKLRRFVVDDIVGADDPPHRIALGVGIAMFVTFTPTIGFQSALVIAMAVVLKANKWVGLPLVWLSNPATFVPIFYPCYHIGLRVTGGTPVNRRWWRELAAPPEGYFEGLAFYWRRLHDVMVPLWIGCLAVAIPLGILSYAATYRAVVRYRKAKRP